MAFLTVPIASTSTGSIVSGTLVNVDPPLDQAEVEHDYRRGVPLREIPDSPPTIAESFFEGPVVTQEECDEADRRWEEEEEELGEVFNQDADALRGGSF